MADGTSIEWTDATWNPITGCSVVSPGCTSCYAMRLAGTRLKHHPSRAGLTRDTKVGPVWTGEVRLNEAWLDQPLRWRNPRMIFVCAHGDLFAEGVLDTWIDRVFAVMALCPQHTFQVLTKRPERMRSYMTADGGFGRWGHIEHHARHLARVPAGKTLAHLGGSSLPNVWAGVSVEDQRRADERIPILLGTPAAVRWISAEPLLGPIDFRSYLLGFAAGHPASCVCGHGHGFTRCPNYGRVSQICHRCSCTEFRKLHGSDGLHWIVAGGESGPEARPMHPEWARSIRDQCAAAGVPFHFKQHGSWTSDSFAASDSSEAAWLSPDGSLVHGGIAEVAAASCEKPCRLMFRVGKKRAGRLLDGVEHNDAPSCAEIIV